MYIPQPTGTTGPSIPVASIELNFALKQARAVTATERPLPVRSWAWSFESVGTCTWELDAVDRSLTLTGHVQGNPFEVVLPLETTATGAGVVRCPTCGAACSHATLLVLTAEMGAGCSRCFPPPKNMPSPAEMRAALEATSSPSAFPVGPFPSRKRGASRA